MTGDLARPVARARSLFSLASAGVVALAAFVFWANRFHQVEQSTYRDFYLPIARSLLAGHGYRLPSDPTRTLLYPLWGYPLLTAGGLITGSPAVALLVVQLLLVWLSLFLVAKTLGTIRWWHGVWLLPFFAVMSVKWPDAMAAGALWLLTVSVAQWMVRRTWWSAPLACGSLVVLTQSRPEYLWLPVGLILLAALPLRGVSRVRIWKFGIAGLLLSVIAMLPWMWRAHRLTGQWMTGSSNQGLVLFISLGELWPNPWGIEHRDEFAAAIVARDGEPAPTTVRANEILRRAWLGAVREHPASFIRKMVSNVVAVGRKGVYIGEYRTDAGEPSRWLEWLGRFYTVLFAATLLTLPAVWIAWPELLEHERYLTLLVLVLVAYKLAVVAVFQYEPRHLNPIVVPVFCATVVTTRALARRVGWRSDSVGQSG